MSGVVVVVVVLGLALLVAELRSRGRGLLAATVRRSLDPLGHVAVDGGLTLTVRRAEIWEVER
jgi:hypothetical protein